MKTIFLGTFAEVSIWYYLQKSGFTGEIGDDRRELCETQKDLAQWLDRWGKKYPKLSEWVEENRGETLTFKRLPVQHHKHLKSTNRIERFNEEISLAG